MGAHDRPVDVGRDSLEDFGVVATFHVLEQCLDLSACWVRVCHFECEFLLDLVLKLSSDSTDAFEC